MSPRTQRQLEEIRESRKQAILQAALKVFAKYGYNGATIDMIAAEASISKGLLYTYFESKEVLLDNLIKFGLEKGFGMLKDESVPAPADKESFAYGLRAMMELFMADNDFWRMYSMLILQKNMADRFQKEVGEFISQYLSVFAVYFQKKGSANPVAEAMLFGAVLDGLMFDLMVAPTHYPLDDVLDMIIEKFA